VSSLDLAGLGLIPLAFLMWLVTYPSRALPMLAPGIERLPHGVVAYLRLAGPAALAALAATGSLLAADGQGHARLELGVLPIAVALCALLVWRTRMLFVGVSAAVVLVAVVRALGAA
jgi:branched-subunit amino acid transport protein